MLQVGCGDSMYGTDRIDFKQSRATTLVTDVENGLPFPNELFDEVFSRCVLEHLSNVGFHLKECHRVLKPNGKIDVTTDNAECYRLYWFGTHKGRYEKLHYGDKHFSIFTKTHLLNHFEKAGFKNIHISYVKTDTVGRWLDYITFQKPRIRVVAYR